MRKITYNIWFRKSRSMSLDGFFNDFIISLFIVATFSFEKFSKYLTTNILYFQFHHKQNKINSNIIK